MLILGALNSIHLNSVRTTTSLCSPSNLPQKMPVTAIPPPALALKDSRP